MKTINNVQKTIITAAFIFSGLLITAIASAEEKDSMSNKSILIEDIADNLMTIENWMIDDSYFSAGSLPDKVAEGSLEIESWMLDENNFSSLAEALAPATEEVMEIEGWMTDESHFSQRVIDDEIAIENWMLRNYYWK